MLLKTILNRVASCKSFVSKKVRIVETPTAFEIEVQVAARANGRPLCSGCGEHAPGYDRLPARRFAFVPLWNIDGVLRRTHRHS